MSTTGDLNTLTRRRATIAATAPACPVCGRPIAARALPPPGRPRLKFIRSIACSTSCIVELKNRTAREAAKEASHV